MAIEKQMTVVEVGRNASAERLAKGMPVFQENAKDLLWHTFYPAQLFQLANYDWNEAIRPELLEKHLPILTQTDRVRENTAIEESLAWLRTARKSGTRLVDAWKMVSKSHKAPKHLKQTVRDLGRYKDQVWHLPAEQRSVQNLLDDLQKKGESVEFRPASYSSFLDYYDSIVRNLKESIAHPEPLTFKEHHEVRKKTRCLKHYFQMAGIVTDEQDATNLYWWLGPVSDEMGKEHDALVDGEIKGIYKPKECVTRISLPHIELLDQFISWQTRPIKRRAK